MIQRKTEIMLTPNFVEVGFLILKASLDDCFGLFGMGFRYCSAWAIDFINLTTASGWALSQARLEIRIRLPGCPLWIGHACTWPFNFLLISLAWGSIQATASTSPLIKASTDSARLIFTRLTAWLRIPFNSRKRER